MKNCRCESHNECCTAAFSAAAFAANALALVVSPASVAILLIASALAY